MVIDFHNFILLFFTERQHSPSVHLVRRRGGMPCWISFSLAVPGFALRNRFRVVRDLCFTVVEGPLCARLPIYFLIQRRRSPSAHLVRRNGGTHCWLHFSWLLLASAQNRFRVVRALRVFSGGRSVVRALTIIFLANVSVHRRATCGA